ncbi:MAG: SpoIIE family protein phosphatase [Bacteroidetes bacterium]|nr:SpoIIE family protein phosphatase [Bacteroidota bacterium]
MNLLPVKPSLAIKFFIWVSIIPTLAGQIFKIQHWPGASMLMLFGTFVFAFFYLPLFVTENWKTKESSITKSILIFQSLVIFIFAIGFLFKIQHWPGAGLFYYFNNFLLLFIVLPYAFYHFIKAQKGSLDRTNNLFLLIYFFSHCTSALINSGSGKINIDSVLQQGVNSETAFKTAYSRNKQLYATLNSGTSDKNSEIFIKANKLKTLTDSTVIHIKELKSSLVVATDNIPKVQADTLSSINIVNKVNYDVPTFLMIGNEYNVRKDRFSAYKLKSVINNFRDSLISLVQEQNRAIIKEGLNLSTDNYADENGEPISWEMTNFNHMPLLYVFNTLTNIQYEAKNAEYQALTDIINSGNKELNTALFSQIAQLNSKYDAVKKQEEISKLQSENDKGMQLLNAKDSELSNTRQAVVLFVLIILVFIVLVFFVIRSNYLRRQANKTLQRQKEIIELQKSEVENQKTLVEEKQKEIIESITYAKHLQEAILPPAEFINKYLPDNFVVYKPKDIVAGDFYWAEKINDLFFIAAADSTGHGVPGAMVSVVCSNALNRTVKEFNLIETGKILDKTRELVLETFEKSTSEVKDGMDISLLCIDLKNQQVYWSGANNPLWYMQDDSLIEIKPDKQPIGKTVYPTPFTTHKIEYRKNTSFYLITDGFADQFGGEKGKKYMYKQLKENLTTLYNLPMQTQKEKLEKEFQDWKGNIEQVDDVTIIGVKI